MYRLFLSLRYLRRRFVNYIAVAGVCVGVAVLIVVVSVMDGFQQKVREVLRGTLSHLTLTPDGSGPVPPAEEVTALLKAKEPRVVATSPWIIHYVVFPYERDGSTPGRKVHGYHPMQAIGIDWEIERTVSELRAAIVAAEDPDQPFENKQAKLDGKDTILVSRSFVNTFMGQHTKPADVVGKKIDLLLPREVEDPTSATGTKFDADTRRPFISAVFDGGDQNEDLGRVYFRREFLRAAAKIEAEYAEIHVRLSGYGEADSVKERLTDPARGIVGFKVQTWEDVRAQYLRAVNNEKVLLLVVLSFIVLLAGFVILATLSLTVVEKTRDIGLLKALGATTGGVLSLFLRSGFLIGVLGSVLGVLLGIYVTWHVNDIKDGLEEVGIRIFPPDIYLFREIPTVLETTSVVAIGIGASLVSFLAGLPPALRAARMDPATALRHE